MLGRLLPAPHEKGETERVWIIFARFWSLGEGLGRVRKASRVDFFLLFLLKVRKLNAHQQVDLGLRIQSSERCLESDQRRGTQVLREAMLATAQE